MASETPRIRDVEGEGWRETDPYPISTVVVYKLNFFRTIIFLIT